jgi:hypothetical protein
LVFDICFERRRDAVNPAYILLHPLWTPHEKRECTLEIRVMNWVRSMQP